MYNGYVNNLSLFFPCIAQCTIYISIFWSKQQKTNDVTSQKLEKLNINCIIITDDNLLYVYALIKWYVRIIWTLAIMTYQCSLNLWVITTRCFM